MTDRALYDEIIDYLRGSCCTLHEALGAFDSEKLEDDMDFLKVLDDEIFLCEDCQWWCPVEEMTDENTCSDCGDE